MNDIIHLPEKMEEHIGNKSDNIDESINYLFEEMHIAGDMAYGNWTWYGEQIKDYVRKENVCQKAIIELEHNIKSKLPNITNANLGWLLYVMNHTEEHIRDFRRNSFSPLMRGAWDFIDNKNIVGLKSYSKLWECEKRRLEHRGMMFNELIKSLENLESDTDLSFDRLVESNKSSFYDIQRELINSIYSIERVIK